jgi:hypothetical protein
LDQRLLRNQWIAKEHAQTMSYDVFGDSQEWGLVLDHVQRLREEWTLDDHQQGLARLGRYPCNWQLRQAGLRAELQRPIDEVIRGAVQMMADKSSDGRETRILAGGAVSTILSNRPISESGPSNAAESIRRCSTHPHAEGKVQCS